MEMCWSMHVLLTEDEECFKLLLKLQSRKKSICHDATPTSYIVEYAALNACKLIQLLSLSSSFHDSL